MPRNSEGEFEMVVGNKQLMSLFFLVVVLFAVFFSLGYVVGRSAGSPPTLAAQPSREAAPEAAVTPAETRPSPVPRAGAEAEPPAAPRDGRPDASEPKPEAAVKYEPEPKESLKPAGAAPAREEAPPPLVVRDIHLQLAATRVKGDGDALVEALRKKGYAAQVNSQTRDGWHRVIVGPFPNERAAQEMKARLEKDGYKSILKKP